SSKRGCSFWGQHRGRPRTSRPDRNAFHPRKGKPRASVGRKETALAGNPGPEGCSTEGVATANHRPSRDLRRQEGRTKSSRSGAGTEPGMSRVAPLLLPCHLYIQGPVCCAEASHGKPGPERSTAGRQTTGQGERKKRGRPRGSGRPDGWRSQETGIGEG